MAKFDIASAIASIAPTLATMLGGPLAGTAVTALENALGLTQGSGLDGITNVLQSGNMTPEVIANVRAADQKHAEIMAQQQIDIQKLNLDFQASVIKADTDNVINARNTNVQGGTTKSLFILSLSILITCFGAEVFVLFNGYPKTVPDIVVGRVLGLLDAASAIVLNYWYGTSHGSAMKNELLRLQQK